MDNLDTVWHQLSPFRPVFSFIPSISYSFLACLCLSPLAWSENVEDISDFSLNYNCILVILYGEFLTLECPICKLTNYPTNISPTLPKNRLTNSTGKARLVRLCPRCTAQRKCLRVVPITSSESRSWFHR